MNDIWINENINKEELTKMFLNELEAQEDEIKAAINEKLCQETKYHTLICGEDYRVKHFELTKMKSISLRRSSQFDTYRSNEDIHRSNILSESLVTFDVDIEADLLDIRDKIVFGLLDSVDRTFQIRFIVKFVSISDSKQSMCGIEDLIIKYVE